MDSHITELLSYLADMGIKANPQTEPVDFADMDAAILELIEDEPDLDYSLLEELL